jgi:membrane-bound lytic murein transglycosylase D
VQDTVAKVMPQLVRLGDEKEWNSFWTQVESALQSQSLDDLGWMMSSVDMAYEYVNAQPDAKPLADWLKQRRDYFDMAGMAIDQVPEPAPAVAVTSPVPPAASFQLPAAIRTAAPMPAKPKPASAPVLERRLTLVRSQDAWKSRLRGRALPKDAQRLVPQMKKTFDTEGTPQRWVWMAEVESSLNPEARSPVGAVGLFQLMPETAKRFGLKTFPFDDRVKPDKNARAAAQYLKILYRQFGSWSLALAAYNAGEGRVGRAMKQHGAKTYDDVARHLPVETQMYVPKVMATVAMREDQANGVPYAVWVP